MNKIKKYTLKTLKSGLFKIADHVFINERTEFVKYSDVEQLQARIKELESDKHINEIKAQGIEEAKRNIIDKSSNSFIENGQYDGWYAAMRHFEHYAKQLRNKHE